MIQMIVAMIRLVLVLSSIALMGVIIGVVVMWSKLKRVVV